MLPLLGEEGGPGGGSNSGVGLWLGERQCAPLFPPLALSYHSAPE